LRLKGFIFLLAILSIPGAEAQLFSRKDLGIHQGIINFHSPILNNKNNNNKLSSWVTEVDKNFFLTRFASFNAGLGLGNYKNMDTRFLPFRNSNFFRMNTGLILHLPQFYSALDLSPNLINPYFKAAYNFDLLEKQPDIENFNRLSSSLRLGLGCIVKLNHYLGISYEASHNQRVAPDYRSFFQHTFGVIINLEAPAKPF
jgi:hypothetical protein